MPHFKLETNIDKSKIPADLTKKLCEAISSSLNIPLKNRCVASIVAGVDILWSGTNEPCAHGTLMSIGELDVEKNKEHSKVFFDLICKELGISPERMYITYASCSTGDIGFNGTTFHVVFGE